MSVAFLSSHQSSPNLSLRDALERFRADAGIDGKFAAAGPDSRDLLDKHDVIHVLFGLDTSIRQEAMADFWTLFGTDAKFADLRKYFDLPEQQELVDEFGWPKLAALTFASLPQAVRIAIRARKLKRKWPWNEYHRYLDVPVTDIRREFGIDLVEARPA
ncbi:hypothetical protein SAMN02745824_3045 [Parasphingorhabdus marina DSM 22363]|uniref:Uncharacterized protein n=1 Tax=Parasphingorhabdus marina DSM 22363 TaxID=1123272 RepID=A0A1N6GY63_9SPHN|nr:hypothetical protein [Parasphingorhabdus marina]SIO12484.1 hypothetical protein SAMN02745824_3045 [Parasphingorhabdus marina DSM 22363]